MIVIGRRVYGLGAIVLGIVQLVFGAFSADWLPVPAHIPTYHILVYASAALLIVGGATINARPPASALAALALAALFAAGMLAAELPHALARPADWGGWQAVAESTVMALGGVLAYVQTPGGGPTRAVIGRTARWLLAPVC